jgi:hypothetical protein
MATVDVLRPISTRHAGAATVVPSGTLNGVTSDNSDATYARFLSADFGLEYNLRVAPHTPAAGYERHRVRGRIRIRCDLGTCTEDIDLGRGTSDYIGYDTVPVNTAFAEQSGSWYQDVEYGLDTSGALSDLNIGGGWFDNPAGGATETRTAEMYVDIDCRLQPDYAPEIQDNAGVDQSGGTVTDTNQPDLFFGAVGYDGLPALSWSVVVKNASAVTVFSASGAGSPPTTVPVTTGLNDGLYTADFSVISTIRGADPFEHAETLGFTIENTVPPPSPPLLTVEPEDGGYRVTWTDPGGQAWDNGYVVAELWRDDCTGSSRIAVVPDALSGSYLDLAIPQLDPQTGQVDGVCTVHSDSCDITYRVRYQGYVSTFVELPDTIPADMILGWPGTAASIPSGWSRVTALDGYYPRGATGTGAPITTGGAATHTHTLPSHTHSIPAHSHTLGGNVGTNSTSTTSARFNGASKAQADQPHSHVRPASVGSAGGGNLSSATPGTSVASNVPLTREVIWVKSDGAQANYATGILGWATESVSGWDTDAPSAGRFLRGAAAAGNGGASNGAATHLHTVDSHSHGGIIHDHAVGNTGLSNPASSQEAGTGSSTPRWLPRHTHPMDAVSASTGATGSDGGGNTSSVSLDPPNRRLRVLVNSGGGTQTRIIGLYTGTVAALDPLLTLCDGSAGTPDMRTWFARDAGSDSVNSTGGTSVHTHTTGTHVHDIGGHSHDTNVFASATTSYEAPTHGDLGDSPTTSHTHPSGSTGSASPNVSAAASGTTSSVSTLPVYKEVHFVRLDGTISGGPLAVPELKTTDFASATVPAFTYSDGLDRLASFTDTMAVVTDRSSQFPRLVADSTPLDGGLHSVSTTLAGEDLTLSIAVEGRATINELEELLRSDRVYFSPVGGTPGWFAPGSWRVSAPSPGVKVLALTMVRQPWPPTADPGDFL